jgi:NitT/TauT family transport system substrate-binding protein
MKRLESLVVGGSLLTATMLPARAQTPSPTTVRIMCTPTDSFGEAYYAQDMGFFAQHNINVEFVGSSGGAIAINALAGNSVDVGVANPLSTAQAFAKGIPISILAGGGLYTTASPAALLLVPKSSTARTPKDLEGKTIGLPGLGDQLQAATTVWLQKNGVDPAKVRFIEVNPGAMIRLALERGRVDAATAPEPTLTESVQDGARVFGDPFAAVAPRFFIGIWVARNDWIKANPDVARHFADAIYDAGKWANAHKSESAAILAKYAKGDAAVFRSMHRATYPSSLDPKLLAPPIDAGLHTGLLSSAVNAADLVAKGF